jgi:ABC-type dipeptide/oligopeptide/nickel transport system permease component
MDGWKSGAVAGNVGGVANRALIVGVLSVVSFPVFWLGIYAVFAAGSFVLGGASIREATGGAKAKAIVGVVLAAIATVFCALLNLFG